MTELQYTAELKRIKEEALKLERELNITYAESRRLFKIGDIVRKNSCTILIHTYGTDMSFVEFPRPIYIGVELRKDLQPKKNGELGYFYGNDNIELIKRAL